MSSLCTDAKYAQCTKPQSMPGREEMKEAQEGGCGRVPAGMVRSFGASGGSWYSVCKFLRRGRAASGGGKDGQRRQMAILKFKKVAGATADGTHWPFYFRLARERKVFERAALCCWMKGRNGVGLVMASG